MQPLRTGVFYGLVGIGYQWNISCNHSLVPRADQRRSARLRILNWTDLVWWDHFQHSEAGSHFSAVVLCNSDGPFSCCRRFPAWDSHEHDASTIYSHGVICENGEFIVTFLRFCLVALDVSNWLRHLFCWENFDKCRDGLRLVQNIPHNYFCWIFFAAIVETAELLVLGLILRIRNGKVGRGAGGIGQVEIRVGAKIKRNGTAGTRARKRKGKGKPK